MIYPILPDTDPMLSRVMPLFDFDNPIVDPVELAINLFETMEAAHGIGLAANQVGIETRVFVMLDPLTNTKRALFNPVSVGNTSFEVNMREGCLTFPGMMLDVKREESVEARYQDETGEQHSAIFTDWAARIFLHEYDHLYGVVFTSRVSRLKLDMARKKLAKRR